MDNNEYLAKVHKTAREEVDEEDFKTRVIQEKQKIRAHKPKSLLRWLFSWI